MNKDTFLDTLKLNKLSNTKSRQAVFNILKSVNNPISMNELIKLCNLIDRVSVYRTIETFENIGIVNKVHIGWKYKIELSDNFKEHHHHMSCMKCGKVIDFEEPHNFDLELTTIALNSKFEIKHHTLELRGFCINCQVHTN